MADMSHILTRPGVDPQTVQGKPAPPPLRHELLEREGLVLEKDHPVVLRDGVTLYVDIYRPSADAGDLAVLLAYGPYGKHWVQDAMWPPAEVEAGWIGPLTGFEAPDAGYWCRHGYAVVLADPRGLWHSEGVYPHHGPQEREDVYDVIEHLGALPWSNGSVGMLGVSYLAATQYQAASLRPPSLKAISPWEAFSDWYREFGFHGGIPETGFKLRAWTNAGFSLTATEDGMANMAARPLDDADGETPYYSEKQGPLEDIDVPAYVVASWSDHGLHSRGTLEAFARMGSTQKWLEVHGEKKWRYFYKPESVERQRAFFDRFLLGVDSGVEDWPRVRVQVRSGADESEWAWRNLDGWPVPDEAVELHLDAASGTLSPDGAPDAAELTFDPLTGSADFDLRFDEDTVFVGPAALSLTLAADEATDADVFVVLRKLDEGGDEVLLPFNALFRDGPVALGWLRASHRELDPARSTTLRPFHPHTREERLTPGRPVTLDIEIWPFGDVFRAGETLRLTIQGRDFRNRPAAQGVPPVQMIHEDSRTAGTWTVRTGRGTASVLRLPRPLAP